MKIILLVVIFLNLFTSNAYADGNTVSFNDTVNDTQQNQLDRIISLLNSNVKIPDTIFSTPRHDSFWTIISTILGALFGFLLVILVEKIKTPSARIELFPELVHSSGRKFLKIKVVISTNTIIKKIFPWQNAVMVGRIKGSLISLHNGKDRVEQTFTLKWDSKPEPWDYVNNVPRLELLPAASEAQNFLSNDEDSAAVVVKHPNQSHFYIYDGNYYVNPTANQRNESKIKLRLAFTSTSTTAEKEFMIMNYSMNSFRLLEE